MPCHGCAANFSLFVKEYSCPNCKFSFCSKCLKGKVSTNEVSQKVCSDCYKKLTSNVPPLVQHLDPPALLLKRLETLENPAKPPITIFKHKGKLSYLKANLDPEDREIVERLEKLKEDRKMASPPSESELKHRLMMLKGLNYESNEKPQIIQSPAKSEQEQVDDLITQYMNEMTLEGKISEDLNNSLEDIKERIQKLNTTEYIDIKKNLTSTFESVEGDAVSKKMIEKVIAEAKLEKKLKESGLMYDDDDDDDDDDNDHDLDDDNGEEEDKIDVDFEATELPWCIICNADATLKCVGCDGSLYCNACFKQGHEYFDMEDHKTVKFK